MLRASIVAFSLVFTGLAHALTLGDLQVKSGLGQPFLGVVPYTSTRGDELQAVCIRTRYDALSAPGGVPELPDPRIVVEPAERGGNIIVRTTRPLNEPLLHLALVINCGTSVTAMRDYSVSLDPPAQQPAANPQASGINAPAAGTPASAATGPANAAARRAAAEAGQAGNGTGPTRERANAATAANTPNTGAPTAAARPKLSTTLPYEPGVTPPPGRRAPQPAAKGAPQYRLTLSRPVDTGPTPSPVLAGATELGSLGGQRPAVTEAERDLWRKEWALRQSDDPVGDNLAVIKRAEEIERSLAKVKNDLLSLTGQRSIDAKRIAQLEQEKRDLETWLNGLAMALGFIGCVAVAALVFWNYRRRTEQKAALARRVGAFDAGRATGPVPAAPPERVEPQMIADESAAYDHEPQPETAATEPPAAVPQPARPAQAKPARAPAKTPPVKPTAPAARVATPRPTPPGTPPAPVESTHVATIELDPRPGKPPPVEDFYANPPRGADEPDFSLDDPPVPAVQVSVPPVPAAMPLEAEGDTPEVPAPQSAQPAPSKPAPAQAEAPKPAAITPVSQLEAAAPTELPPITFELPKPAAPASAPAGGAAGDGGGDDDNVVEFSLDDEPPINMPPLEMASAPEPAKTGPAKTASQPALNVPLEPPPAGRTPAPTMTRMQAIIDEVAAAALAVPGEAPQQRPAAPLPGTTGAHRTIDIDLGTDGDAEMRAQLYRQEFELKLFPEIVHGQAKLKVPQSVISLARTYYQEDFDTNRAINLLEYAADRTPDPQRVRLALLEILRMEGMAREYVAVARGFESQFPDADEWETVAAYGKLLAPEDPLFADADATGYDLNMPSMWLGSTLDMTRYVLAQDLHDAMRGPAAMEDA